MVFMDDTKLSKKEEAYIDALIEGLESLMGKLSTTERNYIGNDVIACNTALNSLTVDGFYNVGGDGRTYYYCRNHDVATGAYECPCADVIDNTICCTQHCKYNGNDEKSSVVNNYDDAFEFPF